MVDNFATDDTQIEKWKVKRLIKNLDEARGNGTSFVSLYIPQKEVIGKAN
jgi:peptide chain release factor subunit 1